jgi:hypothetical protein
MQSQGPLNPYDPSGWPGRPGSNGNGEAHTRDRLGRLETRIDTHAERLQTVDGSILRLTNRVDSIEQAGAQAIEALPGTITAYFQHHLAPFHERLRKLETSW